MKHQEKQKVVFYQQLAKNVAANEAFILQYYPDEIFINDITQLQTTNKYLKGIIFPENIKVAISRMPRSSDQRYILRKELRQAEILAKLGNSVYLISEQAAYKIRPKDAIVNGEEFEFRTITGNEKTLEWEFRDAKKKGDDTNVFINVTSDISKHEARRRVGNVLRRHLEYTGKIIMSFNAGDDIYFWDSGSF